MRRLLERALAAQEKKFAGAQIMGAAFASNYSYWLDSGHPLTMTNWNSNPYPTTNLNTYQNLATTLTPYQYLPTAQVWDAQSGKQFWAPSNTTNPHHIIPELRGPQSVYLKGYGVVYTATVALPATSPADPKQPTAKPLTDWDRERRELRGEKVEPTKAVAPQEALTDALLKVLADNGKHFSQLGETEQLTIALTLPRGQSCTQCHVSKSSPEKSGTGSKTTSTTSSGSSSTTTTTTTSSTEAVDKDFTEKIAALKKDAQKAALLGDLHMKQGKNEQAAASFAEALKLYLNISDSLRRFGLDVKGTPEIDAAVEQELVLTAAKLIQVDAALNQLVKAEEVKKTLEIIAQHTQKTAPPEKTTKPVEPPAKVELPAKLVISAPKKLLDLVGSGKLTFEEFRKNATIDYQPARTIAKP
jgi:hypothetical protein